MASSQPAAAQSASPQAAANCREFQQTITVGGETQEAYGTTCQQPDGRWKVMGAPQPGPQAAAPQATAPQAAPAPYTPPPQVATAPAYPVYPYYAYSYPYPYYSYPAYSYPAYAVAPGFYGRVAVRGRGRWR
jgi:hypothetical protein